MRTICQTKRFTNSHEEMAWIKALFMSQVKLIYVFYDRKIEVRP